VLYSRENREALGILGRMLDSLLTGLSAKGEDGSTLRIAVGDLRMDAGDLVDQRTIGDELLRCFDLARTTGAKMADFDRVREAMMAEAPTYDFGIAVKLSGIVFSFMEQCQVIAATTFVSRFDVEDMMVKMIAITEEIKLEIADLLDGIDYTYLVAISAALVQHLAATERQLPRIVVANMPDSMPSLFLANYFYTDASRSDEIAIENRTVNPVFCQRTIRVLSE
jgi:hypothetical protein